MGDKKETWLEELRRWTDEGTIDKLVDMAKLNRDYHSGDAPADGTVLVRIRRSSGEFSDAVLCGVEHGGRSVFAKLRFEKGLKHAATEDLLRWNPWLAPREAQP